MADFNKLKDTIRGAIYPNGRGAISADKHQAALLDMADTMQETDTKVTELSEKILYGNPLKGVIFGNSERDLALKKVVKYIWLEVLDSSFELPKQWRFFLLRNSAAKSPQLMVQLCLVDSDNVVLSYTNETKVTGYTEFVCNGFSSHNNKVKLHFGVDFSELPDDINYASFSTYINTDEVNRYEVKEDEYLDASVKRIEEKIKANEPIPEKVHILENDVATIKEDMIYANPLAGVVYGNLSQDATIKNTIKSVYIEVIDESIVLPDKLGFYLFRNSDAYASNQVMIQFCELGKTDVIFSYVANNKATSLTSIIVAGHSAYADKVKLHITYDFSNSGNISFDYNSNSSYLETAKLNRSQISEVVTLKNAVQGLQQQVENTNKESALYSDGCKGIQWGKGEADIKIQKTIKSIWFKYLDPSLELPSNLKFSVFKNTTSGSGTNFWIQITDLSGNVVFQYYIGEKQTGINQYMLEGYSTYAYRIQAFVECDFANNAEDFNFSASKLNTIITTAEVNSRKVESLTIDEGLKEVKNVFEGKTIVCFGDSLTYQTGNDGLQYTDYIHQYTNANVINVGIGGTQLRQRTLPKLTPTNISEGWAGLDIVNMIKAAANIPFDDSNSYRKVVENAAIYIDAQNQARPLYFVQRLLSVDWSKVDVVTIFAGTNDWMNGGNMRGETGSNDENTTLGAINEIIRILLSAYPHIKLYWFTPVVRWQASSLSDRTIEKWGDNYVVNNYTLKQFSSDVEAEVRNNHIPVCDMYNTLGWNMYNFSQYFNDNDGVHPSKGYKEIALRIIAFIETNRTF